MGILSDLPLSFEIKVFLSETRKNEVFLSETKKTLNLGVSGKSGIYFIVYVSFFILWKRRVHFGA